MSDTKLIEGSKEYYVRTDMGEFRVFSNDDLVASWMSGECKAPIPVTTLTGFICKIKASDIKTIGLLEDYLGVLNKGKEVKEIKNMRNLVFETKDPEKREKYRKQLREAATNFRKENKIE